MTFFHAALLGVVQGLTEFLPVSSSAHLILARALLGWDGEEFGLAFDVACHVGTLVALIVYFRREIGAMAAALPALVTDGGGMPGRLIRLIAVGTIPVVVAGVLFDDVIQRTMRTPGVAATALAVGALVLVAAERAGTRTRSEESVTVAGALAIGCGQAAALIPGVSRSGATIALGIFLGLRRDAAARFGFLLGIPAVLAAAALEGLDLARRGLTTEAAILFAIGALVSAGVGYATVKYFIRYLAGHSLNVFAVYRCVVAAGVLVWWAW